MLRDNSLPNMMIQSKTNNHLSISKIPIHRESIIIWLSALYICRESSTNQPFLCKTNPILSAVGGLQMNVTLYNTTAYKNNSNRTLGQNKPNSNPIKANFFKSQNECKLTYNKGLQKKRRFRSPKKQTQFKPNFRKAQNERKVICYRGL